MAVKRITKRCLYNSFFVILLVLITLIVAFSVFIRIYFYNNVLQLMRSAATINTTLLINYSEDNSINFSSAVLKLVEDFEEKDKMELMAINSAGKIIITSSGFTSSEPLSMPDYEQALTSPYREGIFEGSINQEPVIAYTALAPLTADSDLVALRYVVSLSEVNRQIILYIALMALLCMIIIFFVGVSSSYFISSIVNPVDEIGKTARLIAQGDFSVRLKKKHDDEVGELCDVINYMAEELQETENMKNDFISSVSHELRTPLTAIRGWAETLNDPTIDPDSLKKGMGVILKESDRLSQMVEELLDFSRIQSGRFKLTLTKLDLVAELSDAVLMFTERAKLEQIELIYDEPLDIIPINADSNRLRQVFVNILDNALKYSDSGGTVTVQIALVDDHAVISISDTGCGISEVDLPQIKKKFYKANSTRRGSGIGLAVADEIVSLHGGTLEVQSQQNVGTTVSISLPVYKNPAVQNGK